MRSYVIWSGFKKSLVYEGALRFVSIRKFLRKRGWFVTCTFVNAMNVVTFMSVLKKGGNLRRSESM